MEEYPKRYKIHKGGLGNRGMMVEAARQFAKDRKECRALVLTYVVVLRNEVVQRVNKAKFLGVIVDQHLNWKDHISMISQKISE